MMDLICNYRCGNEKRDLDERGCEEKLSICFSIG